MNTRRSKRTTSASTKDASQSQSGILGLGQRTEKLKRNRAAVLNENNDGTKPPFRYSWDEFQTDDGSSNHTKIMKRDHQNNASGSSSSSASTTAPVGIDLKDNLIKEEHGDLYESDEDQENFDYMQIRMQNMKDNENFLASIGISKAKDELMQTLKPVGSAKKSSTSQRGLKMKKEPAEPLPRRKSYRINKMDPSGKPLPENEDTKSFRSLDSIPFSQIMFSKEDVIRLSDGPLAMKDCVYSKYDDEKAFSNLDQFCSFMNKKSEKNSQKKVKDIESSGVPSKFDKLSLTPEHVAKVVPGRVFSVEWFPSNDKLMAVAGDKYGHIGFWNVMAEEKEDGSEIVTAFKPHVKPVPRVLFSSSNKQKLYSCSYDATLRSLDFEKSVFDDIFSVPEEDDDLFRDFNFVDSNVMVVAHYTGFVSVVDIRTPSTSAEHSFQASKKNLHSVHVNPTSSNHFITTGADATINVWDLRQVDKKCVKSLTSLTDHSKTVSSAYFSPNGQQILSCSADDTILVYSVENSTKAKLSKRIRHNNWTGRWLTKFRPTWHPTMDNVFVSGSMARPRRIEIFNSTQGSLISSLESEDLNSVCSLNSFHPLIPTMVVGANSSGRLHVFM